MAQPPVGIDLGTSTSEIAYYDSASGQPQLIPDPLTGSPIIPSLVAKSHKGELLVGEAARAFVDLPGRGVREIKRKMGSSDMVEMDGTMYRPEEISAVILTRLKQIASEALGTEVTEAVISVPANFPDTARTATRNAAELAGLTVLRLVNEPTAAAMAYGILNLDKDEKILVFDFGGGTLDISILEMFEGVLDVKSSFGDVKLGGKDIDAKMIELIKSKFMRKYPNAEINETSMALLKGVAEKTKISLSANTETMAEMASFAVDRGSPVDLNVEVARHEFEWEIRDILERTRKTLTEALRKKNVYAHDIDKVLLVGGTTYIPSIRKLVRDFFGKDPQTDVNPDKAVSLGTAIKAGIVKAEIPTQTGLIVTDVCPFGLGVRTMEKVGTQIRDDCYQSLIQPNTTVPYSGRTRFSLIEPDQDKLKVEVYQDHDGAARYIHEAVPTGYEGTIIGIPPSRTRVPHEVEVSLEYNANGLIEIMAKIPATGHNCRVSFKASGIRMSQTDLITSELKLKTLLQDTSLGAYKGSAAKSILTKSEQMLKKKLSPSDSAILRSLVNDLKSAMNIKDARRIEIAVDKLTDTMFEMEKRYR